MISPNRPLLFVAAFTSFAQAQSMPTTQPPSSFRFDVGPAGLISLKHTGDTFDTDYAATGQALGGVTIAYRTGGEWKTVQTDGSQAFRRAGHAIWTSTVRDGDLEIVTQWELKKEAAGDRLGWSFTLCNRGTGRLEVGDLAVPMRFNTRLLSSNSNTAETTSLQAHRTALEGRQIPHVWVAGHGSFVFLQRPNGVGPFLVMTPTGNTRLEMSDNAEGRRGEQLLYIHSVAKAEQLAKQTTDWQKKMGATQHAPATRLGNTSLTLAAGEQAAYGFDFRFTPPPAAGLTPYDAVRQALYEAGKPDVQIAPGMTVPTDLSTTIAVRSRAKVDAVVPEFAGQTDVLEVPAPATAPADTRLFRIRFRKLGENLVTIRSGGHATPLEFFVTEPIEILIKKRAAFLVSRSQWKNTGKWYEGVFTEWDAIARKLRSPDDRDGLFRYILTCDDPGLGKAPFLASKNAFLPKQDEVTALDYYIHHFVWGGLQMTDKERYPYALYGINDWHENRNSPDTGPKGRDHVWRIYDYPHVALLYYRMYQIATYYPAIKTELSADDYLTRACGTAMAYFEVPTKVEGWSAYETGTYNEVIIPDLIDALSAAGRKEQAEQLRAHWEQKVKAFVFAADPYLYGSEYAFDSTTFEGSAALAKWAIERMTTPGYTAPPQLPAVRIKGEPPKAPDAYPAVTSKAAGQFAARQLQQNLSARGWLENCYYYHGSDYRGGYGTGYLLSYMSQMGGWGVLDAGLRDKSVPLIRLGYASTLSSWALVNSGTPESNYGYWFPGVENDGAAAGGFEPRPFARQWIGKTVPRGAWQYANEIDLGFSGALRSAATVVLNDPVFGPIALGGDLTPTAVGYEVIPRDGLRQRLHVHLDGPLTSLTLTHDAFAADCPIQIERNGRSVRFWLENRTNAAHSSTLRLHGVDGVVRMNGQPVPTTDGPAGERQIRLDVPERPLEAIELQF